MVSQGQPAGMAHGGRIRIQGEVMVVEGTYEIVASTPIGKLEGKLRLHTDGALLSGNIESKMGNGEFSGGTVSGNSFSWSGTVKTPMGKLKLEGAGSIEGDTISGKVKAGIFGAIPFNGQKVLP